MTRKKVPTKDFFAFGLSLIHRQKNAYSSYARLYKIYGEPVKMRELELFKSHFGVTPFVCRCIWVLLMRHDLKPEGGTPIHLLWALLFMKLYSSAKVLASMAGCCKKTYMKWTWRFVLSIASLKSIVLSLLNVFNYSSLNFISNYS